MIRLIYFFILLIFIKVAIGILVPSPHSASGGYVYKRPEFPFLPSISSHFSEFSPTPTTPSFAPHIHFNIPPSFLDNFLHPDDEIYYSDDGRVLKQYEVMERIIGDLQHPESFLGPSPLILDSFLSKLSSQSNDALFNFGSKFAFQPVTRNHGPVALGSGGLGYIRLNNGAAYLGSGSLGYTSGHDANRAIIDAKTRKGLTPPGPLHFGHGFNN